MVRDQRGPWCKTRVGHGVKPAIFMVQDQGRWVHILSSTKPMMLQLRLQLQVLYRNLPAPRPSC